jgi:Spy/CpxP family protein refolding chaperone
MGGPTASGGQENRNAESPARNGLQLGPPGQRWWDDKSFAKTLKLRPEQQSRMDAIFDQNKGTLLTRLQNLKLVESQMDEIARSPNPDETALFTQIDRVAQARAELEKADTHMLLQLRKEMDADQIGRLEKRR